MVRVGIYGATGYTGVELVRILRQHPNAEIKFATSHSHAGERLADVFPVPWDISLVDENEADLDQVDAIFCCLPAGAAMAQVAGALSDSGIKAIDLSADFRLQDPEVYRKWYRLEHTAPDLLPEAQYGLPEIYRRQIGQSRLIANPGCYPTSVLLALYPLLKEGLLADAPLIADSKSGVSGAGRGLNLRSHFVEANENLTPYSIGQAHRHWPEIAQQIQALGGPGGKLIFSPHLLPVSRGILSTVYVQQDENLTADSLHDLFADTYTSEPFVWVLPSGQSATIAHAALTNRCVLSVTLVSPGQAIIVSTIDNLLKGAAGQAVQNFNLMFGLDETTGLVY